jgi:hypothetical protein
MAQWMELNAHDLFSKGSRMLWSGLTDTQTIFEVSGDTNRGIVKKINSHGRLLWQREVVGGNHAYRITAKGVRRLPLVENDPDTPRRLSRILGWPLTWIIALGEGEDFEYSPRCEGDEGKYSLPEGFNIRVVSFWTNGNPERITKIFVRKGSQPAWSEAVVALRTKAKHGDALPTFDYAVQLLGFG